MNCSTGSTALPKRTCSRDCSLLETRSTRRGQTRVRSSLAVGLARGYGSVLLPQPLGSTGFRGLDPYRIVTLEVNADRALVAEPTHIDGDRNGFPDPDEGTNENVMAAQGGPEHRVINGHGPRLFGGNSADRSAGGTGLTTLRQGIREGIREFRDGVRDTVNSVGGRNPGAAGGGAAAGDEPVGP